MDATRVLARSHQRAVIGAVAFCCALAAASPAFAVDGFGRAGDALQYMIEDAELHDVRFINAQLGWAVGDRAAVWHTSDGGRTWRLVPVPVPPTARLESVFFLDESTGWIAGGFVAPYTHASNGVLLGTTDGGRTWAQQNSAGLPGLKRVEFLDPQRGWALGRPSHVYQCGVFTTDNGGRTWRPAQESSSSGWLAGAFVDLAAGAVAGPNGSISSVRGGVVQSAQAPNLGLRNGRAMRFAEPQLGWLVGDGALVLRSNDVGQSWQPPLAALPADAGELFDWKALAVHGSNVWVAGSPGTRVLHSPDAGATWRWIATGWTTPINSLSFLDERRGWAVGALGAILATQDGGQTWQVQRTGGRRLAMLSLLTTPEEIPLELVARLAGNDGYLAGGYLSVRTDRAPGPPSKHLLEERTHAALLNVGGSHGEVDWRFPSPPEGLTAGPEAVVAEWNRAHPSGGLAQFEKQLVRQLRIWRPEIVITSAPGDGPQPLAHLMNQMVMRAVEEAGDSSKQPEQLAHSGLSPWSVKKVFGSLGAGKTGDVNQESTFLAIRLGASVGDVAASARGYIQTHPQPPASLWGFQRLASRQSGESGTDLFAGLLIKSGEECRRKQLPLPPGGAQELKKMADRRRNLDAIIARASQDENGGARLLGQADEMVRSMSSETAGQVLFHLALQFHRAGRGDLAAETLEMLLNKYPDHPTAGKAAEWLVQYWSSSELAWRVQKKQTRQTTDPVGGEILGNTGRIPSIEPIVYSYANVQQVNRPQRAAQAVSWLERLQQPLAFEPAIRFPLAAADRVGDKPIDAERFYQKSRNDRSFESWARCAEGELWLTLRRGESPKPVWTCLKRAEKPKLDGVFDDLLWKGSTPAVMATPYENGAAPAACLATFDDRFLYLAVSCKKAPGVSYPASPGPRTRDADLTAYDRVQIYLDVDRDWVTSYRLTVDSRGWTAEDCWGDASWNPAWFVAASDKPDRWAVELAIPWEELAARPPQPGDVWAVGAMRITPGAGVQSWTQPVVSEGMQPEFGYLMFQDAAETSLPRE